MNISITSKYTPVTYEELVKPFKDYWDDYEKLETDLAAAKADLAKLDQYRPTSDDSLSEADKNMWNAYDDYNETLKNLGDQLVRQGLTAELRRKSKELPSQYNSGILPLISAIESHNADVKLQRQNESKGVWYGLTGADKRSISEYKGGNTPESHKYTYDSKTFASDVAALTDSIINEAGPEYTANLAEAGLPGIRGYLSQEGMSGHTAAQALNASAQSNAKALINAVKKQAMQAIYAKLGIDERTYGQLPTRQQKEIEETLNNAIISAVKNNTKLNTYSKSHSTSQDNSSSDGDDSYLVSWRALTLPNIKDEKGNLKMRPRPTDGESQRKDSLEDLSTWILGVKNPVQNYVIDKTVSSGSNSDISEAKYRIYNNIKQLIEQSEANLDPETSAHDRALSVIDSLDNQDLQLVTTKRGSYFIIPYIVYTKNKKGETVTQTKYYKYSLPNSSTSGYGQSFSESDIGMDLVRSAFNK